VVSVSPVNGTRYVDDPVPITVFGAIWMPACIYYHYVVDSIQLLFCLVCGLLEKKRSRLVYSEIRTSYLLFRHTPDPNHSATTIVACGSRYFCLLCMGPHWLIINFSSGRVPAHHASGYYHYFNYSNHRYTQTLESHPVLWIQSLVL
jgi:hypothetical protein